MGLKTLNLTVCFHHCYVITGYKQVCQFSFPAETACVIVVPAATPQEAESWGQTQQEAIYQEQQSWQKATDSGHSQ